MNKRINVLITGAGAPGIMGTIYSLKNNYDKRKIFIVGTDMKDDVVGSYICDKFYVIPSAKKNNHYIDKLLKICKNENINVLLPQNTFELEILANNYDNFLSIGTKVVLASKNSIKIANDKYHLMSICNDIGVPVGQFYKVNNSNELLAKAKLLGWPSKNIVVKPPISNGMRGVRIISEFVDKKKMFYENKPTSLFVKMNDLVNILGSNFPELIVTEYLPGKEYTVDVFRSDKNITVIPRIRHDIRSGITFSGEVINNKELIRYCTIISEKLNLKNCYGFQFKLDENNVPKILESNPRIQGTMVLATIANANIIYASVKNALNEEVDEFDIKWGTKFKRYWGGIGITDTKKTIFI